MSFALASCSGSISRRFVSRRAFSHTSAQFSDVDEKLHRRQKKQGKAASQHDISASTSESKPKVSYVENQNLTFAQKAELFKKEQIILRNSAQKHFEAVQSKAAESKALNHLRPVVTRYENVKQLPTFYSQLDVAPPFQDKEPSEKDMRAIVSIYHSARNFITLDNVEQAVDAIFAGPNLASTVGSKDVDVIQLYNTLKPEHSYDPAVLSDPIQTGLVPDPEQNKRQQYAPWEKASVMYSGRDSSKNKLLDPRMIQLRDALYGTSDDLKVGYDVAIEDIRAKRLAEKQDRLNKISGSSAESELSSHISKTYEESLIGKWRLNRKQEEIEMSEKNLKSRQERQNGI